MATRDDFMKRFAMESRIKMSKAQKGHAISNETRMKLSKSHLGYNHTDESRTKISKALKGRTITQETRVKIGLIHSRAIKQIDKNTIRLWPSATQVAKELGYSRGNIASACSGKRETASGYKWAFA